MQTICCSDHCAAR